LSRQRRA
jgi:hypothetical protein